MALRIEIAKMYNEKLELRIGDLNGSSNYYNITKEDVLSEISDEIDKLLKEKKVREGIKWEKKKRLSAFF